MRIAALGLALALAACKKSPPADPVPAPPTPAPTPPAPDRAAGYTVSTLVLPGATPDGVFMDYLLYDPTTHAVWVPAGNSGNVDVVDTATGKVTPIVGWATQQVDFHGHSRVIGPSAASLGEGVVYVGNRGDQSVCAVDDQKLERRACGKLDAMPDGVAYVAKTKEVWVTTPRDRSIRILDARTLKQKARIAFDGDPEGFAVDSARGRFYANLEDKDATLAIDLASHKTVATWQPKCGERGPHGLRFDPVTGLLFVACSTKVEALNAAHDGAIVGSADTGDGVDDLDYAAHTRTLYAAASRAGTLTIVAVAPKGAMTVRAVVPTRPGARNGVVDATGKVYIAHSRGSELVVAHPPS